MKHTHEELRALCDAATQGNWDYMNDTLDTPYVTSMFAGLNDICDLYHKSPDGKVHTKDNAKANAPFIAATDPPTVRALLDEIEKLRKALKLSLSVGINPQKNHSNLTHKDIEDYRRRATELKDLLKEINLKGQDDE